MVDDLAVVVVELTVAVEAVVVELKAVVKAVAVVKLTVLRSVAGRCLRYGHRVPGSPRRAQRSEWAVGHLQDQLGGR